MPSAAGGRPPSGRNRQEPKLSPGVDGHVSSARWGGHCGSACGEVSTSPALRCHRRRDARTWARRESHRGRSRRLRRRQTSPIASTERLRMPSVNVDYTRNAMSHNGESQDSTTAPCKSCFVLARACRRRSELFRVLRDRQPLVVAVALLLVVRVVTLDRGPVRRLPRQQLDSQGGPNSESAPSPGEASVSMAAPTECSISSASDVSSALTVRKCPTPARPPGRARR